MYILWIIKNEHIKNEIIKQITDPRIHIGWRSWAAQRQIFRKKTNLTTLIFFFAENICQRLGWVDFLYQNNWICSWLGFDWGMSPKIFQFFLLCTYGV